RPPLRARTLRIRAQRRIELRLRLRKRTPSPLRRRLRLRKQRRQPKRTALRQPVPAPKPHKARRRTQPLRPKVCATLRLPTPLARNALKLRLASLLAKLRLRKLERKSWQTLLTLNRSEQRLKLALLTWWTALRMP